VAEAEAEAVAEAVAEAEAVADAAQCSEQGKPCLYLFLLQLLELPLPLQLLTVPMLSSQPFSWGLRFQEPRPGGSHWRVWSSFRFSPSKPL